MSIKKKNQKKYLMKSDIGQPIIQSSTYKRFEYLSDIKKNTPECKSNNNSIEKIEKLIVSLPKTNSINQQIKDKEKETETNTLLQDIRNFKYTKTLKKYQKDKMEKLIVSLPKTNSINQQTKEKETARNTLLEDIRNFKYAKTLKKHQEDEKENNKKISLQYILEEAINKRRQFIDQDEISEFDEDLNNSFD